MSQKIGWAALLSVAAAVALAQDRPAPPAAAVRIAVVDLKPLFDADKVEWVKDIDRDLTRIREDLEKRMKEAEPKERERMRADYLEYYSRKKLAIYTEVNRLVESIAKEQGLTLVLRSSPRPSAEAGPETITQQIERREVLFHDPGTDLTSLVLKRLNEDYLERKKKGKEKDF